MLRTTTLAWTGAFLFAGLPLAALPSLAQDATAQGPAASDSMLSGRFHWKGDVEGKLLDGSFLTVSPSPGGFAVSASETRKSGDVAWTSSAVLVDRSLMIERPEGSVGFSGALAGAGAASTLRYVAVFDKDWSHATVTVYRKLGDGTPAQIGSGTLEDKVPFWEKQPGDLLALEQKLIDQAIHKEVDLKETFHLGDYTSLGIKVGAQLLKSSDESSFMRESDAIFRLSGKGDPVWVRTVVEGGPTVSWGRSIPIGTSGASISAGFSAGATLGYTCDDQHLRPEGLDDVSALAKLVADVPAKAFVLPSTSEKALSLAEGSRRTLVGKGSLALSGGAAFGYRLDELGALTNDVQVGVDVGVSVSWGLSGNLQLEFERQKDDLVHLRWTRGGAMSTSAGVSFLLGLYVAPGLQDKIEPQALAGPVVAVVKKGEAYTCVSFNASASWVDSKELVIDLTFDLSDPSARAAFEAAVVGDLRPVQALADAKDHAGLKDFRVQSTLTDALTYSVHFAAFQVLDYDRAAQRTDVHVDVESLDGTKSATNIYTYAKQVHGFFAKLFGGGDRDVSANATDRTVTSPDGASTYGRQVSFVFDQTLSHASHEKVDEELSMAASLFGESAISGDVEAAHAEQAKKGIDKLKVHLDATFGTAAVSRILASDDDGFYIAYGAASVPGEEVRSWTSQRIAYLKKLSLVQKNDATVQEEEDRREAWDLYYAKDVAKLLAKARASKDPAKQVEQFREIAKESGFKLRSLVALCELAGKDDARVSFSLTAKDLAFNHTQGQASPLPAGP